MYDVLAFVKVIVTQLPDTETQCLRTLCQCLYQFPINIYKHGGLLQVKSAILKAGLSDSDPYPL